MKTLVIALTIGLCPYALFAQMEDGTETGSNAEAMPVPPTYSSPETFSEASLGFHVVPPSYANLNGGLTFTGPLSGTPRTCQFLIHDTLLTTLVGRRLSALCWRLPGSATSAWPTADVMYPNYDIYLSGSVPPANRSLTFAQNVVGVQTPVRADSLPIATGSYTFGGSPNAWGPEITFTPWLYTGGHLLIELRQSGFTGTSRSVDAISTSASGYGTEFSACWQSSYTSTTGLQANFCVLRLTADSTTVSVGANDHHAPQAYALHQNYPNPFNPATIISFDVPQKSFVSLRVFDALGREVAILASEELPAGAYTRNWSASDKPSGIYFCCLQAGSFTATKKLVLLK